MMSGNKSVESRKAVLVLGLTALSILYFGYDGSKVDVVLSHNLRTSSDVLLGAKTRVCFRSRFEIGDADILIVISLQTTRQRPLR